MGRKPLSDTAKDSVLVIRMTSAERSAMDAAAEGSGKTVSTWARDELLRLAGEAKPAPKKPARKSANRKSS